MMALFANINRPKGHSGYKPDDFLPKAATAEIEEPADGTPVREAPMKNAAKQLLGFWGKQKAARA